MARIARIVIPHLPHHVTQRGNRRQVVFFTESDYREYLRLLQEHSDKFKLKVMAYCLMPNHIHLIVIPEEINSLSRAIGETHRKYTRGINFRENRRGYLWQGRFSSYILDEAYLLSVAKYVLLNPVKAGIVSTPREYRWSSIRHHLGLERYPLINGGLLDALVDDWDEFLRDDPDGGEAELLRLHEHTGRPLGDKVFIERLETTLNMNLKKRKPGPRVRHEDGSGNTILNYDGEIHVHN